MDGIDFGLVARLLGCFCYGAVGQGSHFRFGHLATSIRRAAPRHTL